MKWPLVLLFAALPLQWFVVAGGLRIHIVAMLAFLTVVLATHRLRALAPVVRVALPFVVANASLCAIWVGANAYHGLGMRQPLQQIAYLGVFVAVGAVVHRGVWLDRFRWVETMRWATLVVTVSLLVAMSVSMALQGVNAASVFARTFAAADPGILQRELFSTTFTGFGINEDAARGNVRHEVFGTLLVALTLSATCTGLRPFRSAAARRLYVVSMALAVTLILISMSRSLMIAAAVWPLLVLARALIAMQVSRRLLSGFLLAVATAVVLALTGVLRVIWVRFTEDTGSYEARDNLLEQALENIGSNLVTGGVATAGASSHNFVIDTWLRAGVFAAGAAVAVVVLLLGLLVSLTSRLHREPGWMLPVTAMLALPLVRLFTSGGGLIPPVSWVGLGLAAGFLTYRHAVRRADAAATERRTADVAP